jgi:hypothetical protein
MPLYFFQESELRGMLTAFSMRGAEQARIARDKLLEIENTLKADKGGFAALVDPTIIRNRYRFAERGDGFRSQLFGFAKTLVRHAAELSKPDQMRLPEYTDANFPEQRQLLLSIAPIYPELETFTLTFLLTKLREALGPDDPFVKKVLGKKSPQQLAAELVEGTKLASIELRTQLLNGGHAAIAASTDPLIVFVRSIEPDVRAVRKDYDNNVEAPLGKWYGRLAQLMFKVYGTSIYPDATKTLRLSYGAVAGYQQNGRTIEPMTNIG